MKYIAIVSIVASFNCYSLQYECTDGHVQPEPCPEIQYPANYTAENKEFQSISLGDQLAQEQINKNGHAEVAALNRYWNRIVRYRQFGVSTIRYYGRASYPTPIVFIPACN